ncbi:MAG: hypothetical protein V7K64_02430 [Nostoc sp.]
MTDDYPVYVKLSAQKSSQLVETDDDYDPTDDYDADEPKYCPRCGQYSVLWGSFDEVWYCQNCDEF